MMPSGTHHFGYSDRITEPLRNTSCSHRNLRAKDHFKGQTEHKTDWCCHRFPTSLFVERRRSLDWSYGKSSQKWAILQIMPEMWDIIYHHNASIDHRKLLSSAAALFCFLAITQHYVYVCIYVFSKIKLVGYHQRRTLIGWATSRLSSDSPRVRVNQ